MSIHMSRHMSEHMSIHMSIHMCDIASGLAVEHVCIHVMSIHMSIHVYACLLKSHLGLAVGTVASN